MDAPSLSFEVLGRIAPVLAWVERRSERSTPETWSLESTQPIKDRERDWLLGELPTYSYDNVEDIIRGARQENDHARLPDRDRKRPSLSPPSDYDLLNALSWLNNTFFIWQGSEPCVRKGRMEELHELAIRWPAGHIVRYGHARAISEGVVRFSEALKLPEQITLLPSQSIGLRGVIRQGLSESHLHLNAVLSAEETWANNILRPMSSREMRGNSAKERRLLVLNLFSGRLLAVAVWYSLIKDGAKILLRPQQLLDLLDRVYFSRSPDAERAAVNVLEKRIREAVYGLPGRRLSSDDHDGTVSLGALIRQPVPDQYIFLQRWMAPTAYRLRLLGRGQSWAASLTEGPQDRLRFVHQLHLAAQLRLIQLSPSRDSGDKRARQKMTADPRRRFLHEALFRYLVCRTHQWQQATQQGLTTGLRHFREFYSSSHRKLSSLTDLQYSNLVMDRLRQWHGLRVLEGRVGPPERAEQLVPWILAYARPEDRRIKKFGLVVHFKKEDEAKEERGFSKGSDSPTLKLCWGRRRRRLREEGMRLYRLLRRATPVTPFVVGIDACNLELATPPEVFAPVFRFLREHPIAPSGGNTFSPFLKIDQDIRNLARKRRLGMTFHVGEDFRHLLSGLRAIDEVVNFLHPGPGDRLGHGTALALQPENWLEHNGYQAVLPALEWLDTLVWSLHFLGPGDDIIGELSLEDKIQRLSWKIYGDALGTKYDPLNLDHEGENGRRRGILDWDWSPLTLWDAWQLRQLDPYMIDFQELLKGELKLKPDTGFCEESRRWHAVQERVAREVQKKVGARNAYLLVALYWMSQTVREKGRDVIVVNMQEKKDLWLELCRRTEKKMERKIYEREIVVEVNPSSNRIIGPMSRYGQHHIFNLTLDEDRRLSRKVRVSVNTDNPAVCNTTLAHEYYLLGEILMSEGVPEAEVVNWLEWLRQNGEQYNFVRVLKTPEDDPAMERVVRWLRDIRPTVLEARTRNGKFDAFWSWHAKEAKRAAKCRSTGGGPREQGSEQGGERA